MKVFKMSEFRKNQVRLQIERAIQKAPSTIDLKRDIITLDEFKGKHRDTTDVITEDVFIDFTKSYIFKDNLDSPSGNIHTLKKITLYAVYSEDYEFKFNDYFYLDGVKYKVIFPKNNYDLFWICDLEAKLDEKDLGVITND